MSCPGGMSRPYTGTGGTCVKGEWGTASSSANRFRQASPSASMPAPARMAALTAPIEIPVMTSGVKGSRAL